MVAPYLCFLTKTIRSADMRRRGNQKLSLEPDEMSRKLTNLQINLQCLE